MGEAMDALPSFQLQKALVTGGWATSAVVMHHESITVKEHATTLDMAEADVTCKFISWTSSIKGHTIIWNQKGMKRMSHSRLSSSRSSPSPKTWSTVFLSIALAPAAVREIASSSTSSFVSSEYAYLHKYQAIFKNIIYLFSRLTQFSNTFNWTITEQ